MERLWSALTAGDALRGRVIRLITSALKRVREQAGAVQCDNCGKWFRSSGGAGSTQESQSLAPSGNDTLLE